MNRLFIIALIIAIALTLLVSSAAFAYDHKTSVDITTVGMGARPIALGGAYVGLADDASAIFTNPAGIGTQKRISFVSMSTQLLTCVDYQLAGFTYPTEYGTFGVGYIGVTTPVGDYVSISGGVTEEGGAMFYSNQMLILSYGMDVRDQVSDMIYGEPGKVKNFGIGADIKVLSQGFSGDIKGSPAAKGFEADLGVIYVPNDTLAFGATLQNIYRGSEGESLSWSTGENEDLPTMLKLGSSYRIIDSVTLALDTDLALGAVGRNTYHGGVEWQIIPFLALRAGVDQKFASVDQDTIGLVNNYTAGVGLNLGSFRFDYAYRQDPQFNEFSTHYFSFCYFGAEPDEPVSNEKNTVANYENLIESQSK